VHDAGGADARCAVPATAAAIVTSRREQALGHRRARSVDSAAVQAVGEDTTSWQSLGGSPGLGDIAASLVDVC
jgi:hypothetical protein